MNEALIVVDVDTLDHWGDEKWHTGSNHNLEMSVIKEIVDTERKNNTMIIFVVLDQSRGRADKLYQLQGNYQECIGCDAQFASRLASFLEHRHGEQFEPVFIKKDNNAFTNVMLAQYLHKCDVEKIKLIGCQTFLCLQATARGAMETGFHVILLAKGSFPPFADESEKKLWMDNVICYHSSKRTELSVTVE